jgi:protein O-mannosyl-transferase
VWVKLETKKPWLDRGWMSSYHSALMLGAPPSTMAYRRIHVFPYLQILIFLLAFLQYVNTLHHDYAWDDKLVITANPYTTKGISGLPDIFTRRVSVPYKNEFRPVPQAMFAVEYQLFHANPHAGHFFNALWYAVACLLVYGFVRFVFPLADPLFSFLVTALFAVHPLHTEVVANIKSRDEILSLLFGLAAIVLSVKALEDWDWKLLGGGIACFVLALLSKSDAVTFLPAVALVAWYRSPELKISRKYAIGMVSLATCSVVLVLLIRHSQQTVSPAANAELSSTVLNNIFLWSKHPHQIVPTSLVIIARYLGLFVYPHPLVHLYGYDQIPLNRWSEPWAWMVLIGVAALVFAGVKHRRDKSPLMFGLVWFAVTYSVYSNFVFFAPDTMADRYMFIPSLGLAIAGVWALLRLGGLGPRNISLNSTRGKAVIAGFALLLSAYFVRTYIANRDWKNDSTLIFNRIQYMENNAAAQAIDGFMLNKASAEAGSPEVARADKIAAMKAFTRAIAIYPDFYGAWISIGKIFAEERVYDKAELAFLRAQQIEPLGSDGYLCLGILHLAQQDPTVAIIYLEKAVLLDRANEEAYVMLGKAYLQADQMENLGSMALTANKWFPNNLDLKALLATYYFRKRDFTRAMALARTVLTSDPENILALAILSSR